LWVGILGHVYVNVEERFRREEKVVFLDLICFDLYWMRSCFSWAFLMRWASVRARWSWAT